MQFPTLILGMARLLAVITKQGLLALLSSLLPTLVWSKGIIFLKMTSVVGEEDGALGVDSHLLESSFLTNNSSNCIIKGILNSTIVELTA